MQAVIAASMVASATAPHRWSSRPATPARLSLSERIGWGTSQLPGSCGGKKVPNYGLPENKYLWRGPCAKLEWEHHDAPRGRVASAACASAHDQSPNHSHA